MEKSTINTYLFAKKKSEESFTKLLDITSYPDLFTEPEKLDISDLSSRQKKYTEGMIDLPDYKFGANYTKAAYDKVKAMEGDDTIGYQLRFGENGEYGAWGWTGSHFINIKAGDVGSKREMELTVYPTTDIEETKIV